MLDLYTNIRSRRKELNISQQELAESVGYKSKSMIAHIEKGEIDLSANMISKFAAALNTTESFLMGWEDKFGNEIPVYDSSVQEVVALYSKCTPEQKAAILTMLRSFVN